MVREVPWRRWLPLAILSVVGIIGVTGLDIPSESDAVPNAWQPSATDVGAIGTEPSADLLPTEPSLYAAEDASAAAAVTIRKHPLGYTTSLSSSEVGKLYVPSRHGGVLKLNGNAKLYYTNGSDLTATVAEQIIQGSLESSLVAQGNPCTYTVPEGRWGWFYIAVPKGTSGIANSFVETGQSITRPWNGWWWPKNDSVNPNMYDLGGPLDKYDQSNAASPASGIVFYQQNLDADPGWTAEGGWAFGVPTGKGGTHGGVDPMAGYTGPYVYGYNLNGGYENNMTPKRLTSTAINCAGHTSVHLRFRRWLCIEESRYDHASVQVSTNPSNANSWVTVWDFSGPTLVEAGWTLQDIDISVVADNQPAVYIRWNMGPTDQGWTWGGWNIDDIQLMGKTPGTAFYQQNMDSNPGWSVQGNWGWGKPAGKGGTHGGADPTSGYTGTNVYGYNLNGGYENNMVPTYLTTTAINCTGYTGVHLRYRRWLGIEESIYDHAKVQVTNNIADANSWVTVWDFSGPTLAEKSWSLQEYDISTVADNKPAVYIRWVMGPTDVGWTWGGWNIDDVELTSGGGSIVQPPIPTKARSWDLSGDVASGPNTGWWGHCWGWSIASILQPQPQATSKNGVYFYRDDMEALYTELADNDPYVDQSLTVWYIPPTTPTSASGQDVDAYCDDLYRILRTTIREDRVPVQSDMRAQTSPPNRVGEVWNHAIHRYSASFSEAAGANNERLVKINMDVYANSDFRGPPTDDTGDRYELFVYQLEFDTTGKVVANSSKQNWISASHYPPHDLLRLTGAPWVAKNPYVTKSRVDGLYQP